jgi:tetratricopeptide (TPR) repeat protein
LDRLVEDWDENRSLSFAADLVGAALVRGMPERAREAAEFIVSLGGAVPLSAMSLARAALGLQVSDIAGDLPTSPSNADLRRTAGRLKARLRDAPRNPPLWVDLARAYTLLGQPEPAVRAMRTALALAPDNRFVLRSAARLFLHLEDPERAYSLLRTAEATRHDPWLLAAEIAVASATERTPRFIKDGERMLVEIESAPLHISELASAIGTIELAGGRLRRARRLFREALRLPTDNALAQAQWAVTNQIGLVLTTNDLDRPRSFEARSLMHRSKGQWEPALEEAKRWLYDEPFSRYAAASASYLASVPLERYEEAADLVRLGLATTPRDPLLLNNLTFALASSGRLEKAEETFRQISPDQFESSDLRATLCATKGLLFYRRGNLEQGRLHYERATDEFRKEGDQFRAALALLYYAREARLAAAANAANVWKAAQAQAEKVGLPEISLLRHRHESGPTKANARRGADDG